MLIKQNVCLKNYSTYRIGGKAKAIVLVQCAIEAEAALALDTKHTVIGAGSKILFSDGGYDGTIVKLSGSDISFLPSGNILVGAGVMLPKLSSFYLSNELEGAEWAAGIPGTLGGAIKMNAGAFGGDICQILVSAEVLRQGKIIKLSNCELEFGYRKSGILEGDVVLSAVLTAQKGQRQEICDKMRRNLQKRMDSQPKGFSCGSVFKKVEGEPAWKFIDYCGLKGYAIGGAQISQKHCNFIINRGNATANDVMRLIKLIKSEVYMLQGVRLDEEVIFVGDF